MNLPGGASGNTLYGRVAERPTARECTSRVSAECVRMARSDPTALCCVGLSCREAKVW